MTPGDPVEGNPLPFDCTLYPAPVDTTGTTGIETSDVELRFGPNPADHTLFIRTSTPSSVRMTDLSGRTIHFPNEPQVQHDIDVSGWPSGVLLVQLLNANGLPIGSPQRLHIRH